MENTKKLPVFGIILMALAFLVLIFPGTVLQTCFGQAGMLLSEILLAACAVIFVLSCKIPVKQAFPLKKPTIKGTAGTVLIWIFGLSATYVCTSVLILFFPQQFSQTAQELGSTLYNNSIIISLFLFAITPAICEEMLFRGFFVSSLYPLKSKTAIIIICAAVFGVFHTDLIRFLPTATLGAVLTIVMLKTKNFFYPVLFHFLNNSLSVVSTHITQSVNGDTLNIGIELLTQLPSQIKFITVGVYIASAFLLPLVLFLALKLLTYSQEKIPSGEFSKGIVAYAVSSGIILFLGFAIVITAVIIYAASVII